VLFRIGSRSSKMSPPTRALFAFRSTASKARIPTSSLSGTFVQKKKNFFFVYLFICLILVSACFSSRRVPSKRISRVKQRLSPPARPAVPPSQPAHLSTSAASISSFFSLSSLDIYIFFELCVLSPPSLTRPTKKNPSDCRLLFILFRTEYLSQPKETIY